MPPGISTCMESDNIRMQTLLPFMHFVQVVVLWCLKITPSDVSVKYI